jgi:beta-lactam-binding protein with PASTA domain
MPMIPPYDAGEILTNAIEGALHPGPSHHVVVPDFVGMPVPDMWGVALRGGVRVKIHAPLELRTIPGTIVSQNPEAGTKVHRDSVVDLDVTFDADPAHS